MLLDLSHAFDTINYNIILNKLDYCCGKIVVAIVWAMCGGRVIFYFVCPALPYLVILWTFCNTSVRHAGPRINEFKSHDASLCLVFVLPDPLKTSFTTSNIYF